MLTPTEVIIIQSEPEKQDKNQFSEKELKLVRFWITIFSSCHILNQKFYNASDFEEIYIFKNHDFEERHIFKRHDFEEKIIFKKHDFEGKIILKKHDLKEKLS